MAGALPNVSAVPLTMIQKSHRRKFDVVGGEIAESGPISFPVFSHNTTGHSTRISQLRPGRVFQFLPQQLNRDHYTKCGDVLTFCCLLKENEEQKP